MQRIATRGAAAAEAFAHGGRHFLAVATAADPEHGVLVLEWQRGRGMYVGFTKLAVNGVAELGSCLLPSGHVLLGLATALFNTQGRASRGARLRREGGRAPHRVKAHDVRSFHPGQVSPRGTRAARSRASRTCT